MRTIIMASALLATGLAVPAMADDRESRCAPGLDSRIVAASGVSKGLEDVGYRIGRIRAEEGCYEVRAVNDSGFPIEAVYTQATGELLRARLR